jgi:hypothetical protein
MPRRAGRPVEDFSKCLQRHNVQGAGWQKLESAESRPPREGLSTLPTREVEIVEAALADCNGRIDGPSGAAAKLGIPRSTLESKIRRSSGSSSTSRIAFSANMQARPITCSNSRTLPGQIWR